MDKITENLLREFSKEQDVETLEEDARFEHFASYLAVRRHFSRAIDTSDLVTGSGGDTGIDAIAVIVNGAFVTDVDTVAELLDQNGYLEANFILVQAERSSSFDASKIGTFGFGALDLFSDKPKLPRSTKVSEVADIISSIYEKVAHSRKAPLAAYITSPRENGVMTQIWLQGATPLWEI